MEAFQMLKHSLKKEHLNFMDGWQTSEAAMSETLKAGNLSSLFVDDPEFPGAALDTLLKSLKGDDCES
jgi:hypothetical protein